MLIPCYKYYIFCSGNVVGQYPYRPGRSCSGCNPRDSCANRLCYSPARRYGRRITPRTSRRKTYRRSFFAYKPRQTVQPRHTSGLGRERYSYSDAEPGEGASEAAAEARELWFGGPFRFETRHGKLCLWTSAPSKNADQSKYLYNHIGTYTHCSMNNQGSANAL